MLAPEGFAKRDGPLELAYPRNANSSYVVSSGAAWNNPAWTTLVDPTLESFVPHEVNLCVGITALLSSLMMVWLEYGLAVGAAGSEVVIARLTDTASNYMVSPGPSTQNLAAFGRTVPIGPKEIPSGSRLSHRVTCSLVDTSLTVAINAYVTGYAGGAVPLTYRPYRLRPWLAGINSTGSDISRVGNSFTVVTPVAWAGGYGNWAEDTAVAPSDLIIWGVAYWITAAAGAARSMYVQIGTGSAGNEVARRMVPCPEMSGYRQCGLQRMRYPLFVKKGERIAIRATATATTTQNVKLLWEAA